MVEYPALLVRNVCMYQTLKLDPEVVVVSKGCPFSKFSNNGGWTFFCPSDPFISVIDYENGEGRSPCVCIYQSRPVS